MKGYRRAARSLPSPVERRADATPRCPLCGADGVEVVFTSVSCFVPSCANFNPKRYPWLVL